MRSAILLLLTACSAGGALPTGGIDPTLGCERAGTEYLLAADGGLNVNRFQLNTLAVLTDLNNVTSCIRSDGAGAAWFFQRNGEPYGMFRTEAPAPGSILPNATNFVVELYGPAAETPAFFTGANYSGSFEVNSLDPFTVAATGTLSNGQNQLEIALFGTATP